MPRELEYNFLLQTQYPTRWDSKTLRQGYSVSACTCLARSILSLNGKKASELRETPESWDIHDFLSASDNISGTCQRREYRFIIIMKLWNCKIVFRHNRYSAQKWLSQKVPACASHSIVFGWALTMTLIIGLQVDKQRFKTTVFNFNQIHC